MEMNEAEDQNLFEDYVIKLLICRDFLFIDFTVILSVTIALKRMFLTSYSYEELQIIIFFKMLLRLFTF